MTLLLDQSGHIHGETNFITIEITVLPSILISEGILIQGIESKVYIVLIVGVGPAKSMVTL